MQDAAWLLPSSSPLRCTSPADVYLLLKSSDFVTHDLSADSVFEGCVGSDGSSEGYRLELVLRKWFAIDPSREMRAFVRDGVLIGMCAFFYLLHGRVCMCSTCFCNRGGISQRDTNYYGFLDEPETQRKIVSSFVAHWATHVQPKWTGPASCT